MSTENSLVHINWECKYYLVLTQKCRRQDICKQIKADIGKVNLFIFDDVNINYIDVNKNFFWLKTDKISLSNKLLIFCNSYIGYGRSQ